MLKLLTASAAAVSVLLPAAGWGAPPESPAVRYGCDHSHTYKQAKKGLRKALRHHQPLTRAQGRSAWHFILCVRKPRYADALRARRLHWKEWRSSYANVWKIRFNGLDPSWQQWAIATGACESGNNPATNTGNGFHGAHQWLLSTWAAAGGAGIPEQHSWHYQAYIAVTFARSNGTGHWPNCP